jgi:hypothetical protein
MFHELLHTIGISDFTYKEILSLLPIEVDLIILDPICCMFYNYQLETHVS